MPINSRAKGASGEREFIGVMKDWLGDLADNMKRNLEQTREGGHDLTGLKPWAIEVKRYAEVTDGLIKKWWDQAVEQAGTELIPVLAYRADRQAWRIRLPLWVLNVQYGVSNDLSWTVEISEEAFAAVVREFDLSEVGSC